MTETEKVQVHELFVKQAHEYADVLIAAVEEADSRIPSDIPQEQRNKVLGGIIHGTAELVKHSMNTFAETMAKKTSELKPEDLNV